MRKNWKSKIAAVALTAALTVTSMATPVHFSSLPDVVGQVHAGSSEPNYAKLLQYSLYFYDANMCGELESNCSVNWRSNCHLRDKEVTYKGKKVDVSGGFHDAGDHDKFGLPQGYSASILGIGYYEYKDAYIKTGQQEHFKKILDHFCDYFKRCTVTDDSGKAIAFCYQVGDGNSHNFWVSPETESIDRPAYFADSSEPATDQVSEAAAALAIHYMNFGDEQNLEYAKKLFAMAKENEKKQKSSDGGNFYGSSGWADDYCLAAAWLYKATNKQEYKSEFDKYKDNFNVYSWPSWDDVSAYASSYGSGDVSALNLNLSSTKGGCKTIDNVYSWLAMWGSARYNCNMQLEGLIYDKYSNSDSNTSWAESQMNFLSGNNSNNQSYIVGYNENSPKYPHHRAASGYSGFPQDGNEHTPQAHCLVGALVGGIETADGKYEDSSANYYSNEVAIDYNAAFTGAVAALYLRHADDSSQKIVQSGDSDAPREIKTYYSQGGSSTEPTTQPSTTTTEAVTTTTEEATTTEEITTTETVTTTEEPTTTVPVTTTTEEPTTTAPVTTTTRRPTTTQSEATTSEKVTTTRKPTTTQSEATTSEKVTTTRKPVTTQSVTTTSEKVTTTRKPVTTQSATTTSEKVTTTRRPATTENAATTEENTDETTEETTTRENPATEEDITSEENNTTEETTQESDTTEDNTSEDDVTTENDATTEEGGSLPDIDYGDNEIIYGPPNFDDIDIENPDVTTQHPGDHTSEAPDATTQTPGEENPGEDPDATTQTPGEENPGEEPDATTQTPGEENPGEDPDATTQRPGEENPGEDPDATTQTPGEENPGEEPDATTQTPGEENPGEEPDATTQTPGEENPGEEPDATTQRPGEENPGEEPDATTQTPGEENPGEEPDATTQTPGEENPGEEPDATTQRPGEENPGENPDTTTGQNINTTSQVPATTRQQNQSSTTKSPVTTTQNKNSGTTAVSPNNTTAQSPYVDVSNLLANNTVKKVTGLKKVKVTKNSASIKWKKQNVTGYKVYLYRNKKYKLYKVTRKNSITIKKLKRNTVYKVRIKAYNYVQGKMTVAKYSNALKFKTSK